MWCHRVLLAALPAVLVLATSGAPAQTGKGSEPLTAQQLEAIWKDFIENDDAGGRKVRAGQQAMIRSPSSAVPFLKARLKVVPAPDAKRVARLIADLDSSDFKTRENAAKELAGIGPLGAPAVEKKLAGKPPLEVQRRLEMLLAEMDNHTFSADELRAVRGIEVLRGVGSPAAVAILQEVAAGAEGAVQTAEARKALAVLGKK